MRQQDTEVAQLRTQMSVAATATAGSPTFGALPSSSSSSSLQPSSSAALELALLKEKMSKLQDELRDAWRLQAENSATSMRLKESSERDEKALLLKDDELQRAHRELDEARAQLLTGKEERERKERLLETTLEVVRQEYQTVKLALENSERDRQRLKNENDALLSRLLKAKDDQVRSVNDLNELIRKKGGAPLSAKDKERAEAERKAKDDDEERRRGEMLSVDIDMTSSGAIIDAVAWQQMSTVVVPKERKRTAYVHRSAQCMTVAYSPSGVLLASGGSDGYVKLLDARSGVIKAQLRGSSDSIMTVSMSADDALMLAAGNDEKARLWALKPQATTAQQIGAQMSSTVKDLGSEIRSELDKTLHSLTDILPFGRKSSLPHQAAPNVPAPSAHAPPPLSSAPHPPKVLHTLTGHTSKIYAGALDVDGVRGSRAYTGSHDRTLRVWDVHSGQQVTKIMCGSSVNHLAISQRRGMDLIASAHLDSHVRLWDASSFALVKDLDVIHHQQVTGVEFSRDGALIVTTSRDHTVNVVDTRTWLSLHVLEGPVKDPYRNLVNWNRAVFSPDAQYVAVGGHLGTVYVWQVDSGKCVAQLNAASTYDGTAASLGRDAGEVTGPQAPSTAITSVDWNRNGRQVIAADLAGNVYFWGDT